jgi:hypothetical protein
MPTTTSLLCSAALVLAPLSAGAAQAASPSPCKLLTASEVAAAAGWTPSEPKEESYGTTGTCTFTGNALKHQTVVVVVLKPAPKVASSTALAAWRNDRAKRMGMAAKVEPVEGLGAPAIQSGEKGAPPTVEAVVGGWAVGVTAPTFEAARALAKAAVGRIR